MAHMSPPFVVQPLVELDRDGLSLSEQRGFDMLASAGFVAPKPSEEAEAKGREILRLAGIVPMR